MRKTFLLALVWLSFGLTASAADIPLNAGLGERIEFVKNDSFLPVNLQVTVFQPDGVGPFPVLVINHGKSPGGNNHLQSRARYLPATREFLKRGYAVVLPMRQGFADSGGSVVGEGCYITGNGQAQAKDVAAVAKWLHKQPWADTRRMLMLGQSHGGLATMAYAQQPDPGFKLFVNFAGGLKYTAGCQWEVALQSAFAAYGERVKSHSIWFYGENDSYFPPAVIGPAFKAFVAAGGDAEMVAYGPFGTDSHAMFGSADGTAIWLEKVLSEMRQVALPTDEIFPQYARSPNPPVASAYAQTADVEALVKVSPAAEKAYQIFLTKPLPRAFAIAVNAGKQNYAFGGDDPIRSVLENCEKTNKESCVLYAVDDVVVWKNP